MAKELHKANIKRPRLRNKFLKDRAYSNLDIKKCIKKYQIKKSSGKTIIPLLTKKAFKR